MELQEVKNNVNINIEKAIFLFYLYEVHIANSWDQPLTYWQSMSYCLHV